jgi:N-acetylglucosamine-6-phosphate deacetylase
MSLLIINGKVLTEQWQFEDLDILIEAGHITNIMPPGILAGDTILDVDGLMVVPGLIDIHIHGCVGFDFCDGTEDAMVAISQYLAQQGITSFLGTSMTLGEDQLADIFRINQRLIMKSIPNGAIMRGIHMEGPFLAREKKGAQSEQYLAMPDSKLFQRLNQAAGFQIKILDVAPELPGAMDLIREAAEVATVSLAHTAARYDQAMEAFANGASHITHLFNAMSPFSHREPGIIGASIDAGVTVELISDGIHLHPSVIRAAFKTYGLDRVVLVSDAMRACGLGNGSYQLGGQIVLVASDMATLPDGTLAGSIASLMQCVQRAVMFGIPTASAIKAASYNPACVAGLESEIGSIAIGKQADLLLLDESLALHGTLIGGEQIGCEHTD